MITYSWEFPRFQTHPAKDGLKDVVHNIEYILTGSDGEGHGYQLFGNTDVSSPDPINFKSFRLLTQRVVEEWVEVALGDELLSELKQTIETQINLQKTPQSVTLNRPW
jgi:hypothetical protein